MTRKSNGVVLGPNSRWYQRTAHSKACFC